MLTNEIYRHNITDVRVAAPSPTAQYSAKVTSAAAESEPTVQLSPDGTEILVPVDFKHTKYCGTVTVTITMTLDGEDHEFSQRFEVVEPLFRARDFSDQELLQIDSTIEKAKNKLIELEVLIRHVIEAYTGKSFGPRHGFEQAITKDQRTYKLDVPIIEFKGISDRYLTHSTTLGLPKFRDDRMGFTFYDVKTDVYFLHQKKRDCVLVEGVFGYPSVPADVKQAAMLLVGLWLCDQTLWRNRWLQAVNTTTMSVRFFPSSHSTGDMQADALLAKYRDNRWYAI